MTRSVLSFLANHLAGPFFEHGLSQIVVVNPHLLSGVVGRIDVDALDLAGVSGEEGFEREQVVPFDDEVVVERRLFGQGQLGVELQHMVRDDQVVALHGTLSFEVQGRHLVSIVTHYASTCLEYLSPSIVEALGIELCAWLDS